jgi:hypothetical protein
MYRSRVERNAMKEQNKVSNLRDTWFRSGGYTSTLTVPATPDGVLAERVRESLEKSRQPTGTKTKVLEDGGQSTKCGLIKSNQFPREKCERENCQLCVQQNQENKKIVCDRENVGYEGWCNRCPDIKYAYIGETSKTAFTRLSQHLVAYRAASAARVPPQPKQDGIGFERRPQAAKSWMWEHTRDVHEGVVGSNGGVDDYNVKVVGKFLKCLYRQVDEDVRMQELEAGGGVLLNSKYEYYMPKSVQPVFRQQ